MKYRVYGLVLESSEPLDELSTVELGEADAATQISVEHATQIPPLLENDAPAPMPELEWPVITRDTGGYRLGFEEDSEFWVSYDGRTIRSFQAAASPTPSVRHYLLDHVLPRALDLWGRNPLHATAVSTGHGVLAFLGDTGTGKSTIAAALVARGCELVSDDCLVLEHKEGSIVAIPSYPGLRLHEDVRDVLEFATGLRPVADYSPKQRVTGGVPLARDDRPLLAVYSLVRDETPDARASAPAEFMALGPADATMALAASAFRIDVARRDQQRQQLGFFAEVARRVPIRRCVFATDLSGVGVLADAILTDTSTIAR